MLYHEKTFLLLFGCTAFSKRCVRSIFHSDRTYNGILSKNNSVVSEQSLPGSFPLSTSGPGTRLMWIPAKSAFRVGTVLGTEWDDSNIGTWSLGLGHNVKATDWVSIALGYGSQATGVVSTAMGQNTVASGNYSTAMGSYSVASNNTSTAMGSYTKAAGLKSTAMGDNTEANGSISTAMGSNTTASGGITTAMGLATEAKAYLSMVMGRFNVIAGSLNEWIQAEPLLVVGNGLNYDNRNNALTLLKNANLGLNTATPQYPLTFKDAVGDKISLYYGNSTNAANHYGMGIQSAKFQIFTPSSEDDIVFGFGRSADFSEKVRFKGTGNVGIGLDNPSELLDVFGRMRVRHKPGNTAGVWMSNSTNSTAVADGAFYGMKTDTEAGIFINNAWRFWVNFVGNGTFTGRLTADTFITASDSRFKKNIVGLTNALASISSLRGVRYDWRKDEFPERNFSSQNQIGFIAQELETIFPEMVFTDEKGYKSVDYARLTPVLVEAIKELKAINEVLTEKNDRMEARLNKIESLLNK
jgi:hypothetical protein